MKKKEQVNHPSHYKKNGKECIQLMEEEFGKIAVYNFCQLNAYKYLFRAGNKDGNPKEQDESKAAWYLAHARVIYTRMNIFEKLIIKVLSK